MVQNFKPMILRTSLRTVFRAVRRIPRRQRRTSRARDGAYRQREAFSSLDRTDNVEVHHALHRRVLSALTFTPLFRGERPRTGHRPRTRARDGRTMDAKLMRWQQIIMTFGARVQIMSTSRSACEMDQESRKYRGACPRRCPPRHATHIVDSHARFRRTQFEKSSR